MDVVSITPEWVSTKFALAMERLTSLYRPFRREFTIFLAAITCLTLLHISNWENQKNGFDFKGKRRKVCPDEPGGLSGRIGVKTSHLPKLKYMGDKLFNHIQDGGSFTPINCQPTQAFISLRQFQKYWPSKIWIISIFTKRTTYYSNKTNYGKKDLLNIMDLNFFRDQNLPDRAYFSLGKCGLTKTSCQKWKIGIPRYH